MAPERGGDWRLRNGGRVTDHPVRRSTRESPQRALESLRRQYEYSPQAFALNRALGDQYTRQFERLYGSTPYGSVEPQVMMGGGGVPAASYTPGITPAIGAPAFSTNIEDVIARNEAAKKITTEKYKKGEI